MDKVKQEKLNEIVSRTQNGGAEIVKFLEKGSAFYAPAASGEEMAESYLKDQKKQLPCAAFLNGEYGVSNLYAGVPVIIGSTGVEKIVELLFESVVFTSIIDVYFGIILRCLYNERDN